MQLPREATIFVALEGLPAIREPPKAPNPTGLGTPRERRPAQSAARRPLARQVLQTAPRRSRGGFHLAMAWLPTRNVDDGYRQLVAELDRAAAALGER